MKKNTTSIGVGDIKVLVFSGWMGDYTVFNPTLDLWDLEKFTIVFMDYRGYGKAIDDSGEYTIEQIALDGAEVATSLSWNKYHLVGHSMGAMAAQKLAVLDKDRVLSVVALTPVPASGFPMDSDNTALFSGAVKSDDNRRTILDFTTGFKRDAEWLDNMVKSSRATTKESAYGAYLKEWSELDFSSDVSKLETPFLVAIGEHDLAVNLDFVQSTFGNYLKNKKFHELKNCGHYPMQEAPMDLVNLVQEFIGNSND